MLRRSWHPTLTKDQISRLRGGKKHDFRYFVGILETPESDVLLDIEELKLRNQMATRRSPNFPDGYEPFQTIFGIVKLNLRTMTIQVPQLQLRMGWQNRIPTPYIVKAHMPACIFNPSPNTEAFHALKTEAALGNTKARIRQHAAENRAKLELVLSLLDYGARIPLVPDPADRFEAYLWHRTSGYLRDLLALLDMPEALRKPSELQLLQAA